MLNAWCRDHGDVAISDVTDDYLTKFVRDRRKGGASGVTIGIDLSYLAGVFKTAKGLWKLPVSLDPIDAAPANMGDLKISTKSTERKRRPTDDEITRLCDYLDEHSTLPMRDIIYFAIESAMRIEEITLLRWVDLNEEDRTIIIRNRKHPREKVGNDQEVPLLGRSFEIVRRQPKPENVTQKAGSFPYWPIQCPPFSRAQRRRSRLKTCTSMTYGMRAFSDCSSRGIRSKKSR